MTARRIVIVAALVMGIGGRGEFAPPAPQAAATPQSTSGAGAQAPRKNACALFDRAVIEAILQQDRSRHCTTSEEESGETTCELRADRQEIEVIIKVHCALEQTTRDSPGSIGPRSISPNRN